MSDLAARLPAELASARARARELALEPVVRAIDDIAGASRHDFLVYGVSHDARHAGAVGPLYIRDLVIGDGPSFPPRYLRWGSWADALHRRCPICHLDGYLFCREWSDNQFDPDWHSDLYVLCLGCPALTQIFSDEGGHSPASSYQP